MKTGRDAARAGRSCLDDGPHWAGLCLKFVREECFDVAAVHASASDAWHGAGFRHPTERGEHVPRWVPFFWTGGSRGFGHVVFSLGGGRCLTNDFGRTGWISVAEIDAITARWGLRPVGWTEDINGARIYNSKAGQPAIGWERVRLSALGPNKRNRDVEVVERRLTAKFADRHRIVIDGWWGPRVTAAYKAWQQRLGFTGNDADGLPGRRSLERLGLTVVE